MTAGPGDEKAASAVGRGHLRASHADREPVIGALKVAFVQGLLAKGEFDLRVGQALASRTCADLAALTADLPAGLAAAKPTQPGRAQDEWPTLRRPGRWITAATALYAGTWAYELFLSPHGGDNPSTPPLILGGFCVYVIVLIIAAGSIVARWLDRRSGGQSPRLSGHRRRAVEGEQSNRPGDDLILCQAPRDTRARRLLGHSVTQRIWRSEPTRRASAGLCT